MNVQPTLPREGFRGGRGAGVCPYHRSVSPLSAGILGAVVGMLVGAIALLLVVRRRLTPAEPAAAPPDAGLLGEIVERLSSPAAVAGEHDQVLAASKAALSLGVVRGQRLAVDPILFAVREVRRTRTATSLTVDLARRGQSASPRLQVQVVPLEGYVVVLADDLTARERADESRKDFVTNITHELKTPVGAIVLLAEAIRDATDDPEALRRFTGRLSDESARLNTLVSQVIELSRLQSDEPHLDRGTVDATAIAGLALDRCRSAASEKGVNLTLAGEAEAPLQADAAMLETAIENLVRNAIAYSDANPRVTVTVSKPDPEHVDIAVSDNGIGIAEGDQARVFDRFFRVDYARSRANGGTGLGLSIVRHVAEVHGGEVRLWSQPGHGSTFTIHLPAEVAP